MIHTEEDDEFERIAHENQLKSGQPYHFGELFVSVSQRNQVLEEAAKLCLEMEPFYGVMFADAIRGLKK
jgi:hypothetical protein